eukprot:m.57688 g.57688  ORF g.57688 m.57688 type:complete len:222 (-) comp7095_c0_seq2:49-714(-)
MQRRAQQVRTLSLRTPCAPMSGVHTLKRALRRELKARLAAMTAAQRAQSAAIVARKLVARSEYREAQRVAVFLSLPDEVDTSPILADIFKSGRLCFVPRYEADSGRMEMLRVDSQADIDSLPLTPWNVRQPEDDGVRAKALATGGLDLILMPGLGFTLDGKRIGRGKGFYDRYLHRCHKAGCRPKTVGLAHPAQLCSDIPTDELDVPLDAVVFGTDEEGDA